MPHWKIFQVFICLNEKYLGCIPIFKQWSFFYVQQILGVMRWQSGLFLRMTAKQCCWNGRGCSTESKGKVAMNCKQRMIDGMAFVWWLWQELWKILVTIWIETSFYSIWLFCTIKDAFTCILSHYETSRFEHILW
jgi:hypothetical protein